MKELSSFNRIASRLSLLFFSLSVFFLSVTSRTYAAPPTFDELVPMVDNVLGLIIPIGALISVGMFIYGGYMWIMSTGDQAKIKSAQGTLTWAVLGLVFLAIFRFLIEELLAFMLS